MLADPKWLAPVAVAPLQDLQAVADLCRDPYIARIGHDHRAAGAIDHPDVSYLGAYVGSKFVGAFCVIESGWIERDVHAMLTRPALQFSRDLGRSCLSFIFSDPSILRVTAQVIEGMESAKNYCLRLGFRSEGFRRHAVMKGGRAIGIHMLGITREDWSAV